MEMLFNIPAPEITALDVCLFSKKKLQLLVVRLDKIHPVVSGNKLFKLHFFLEEALNSDTKKVVTFGGAWSNHLVATAFACHSIGLQATGIVRSERPVKLSDTLTACESYGMKLNFVTRKKYDEKENPDFKNEIYSDLGNCLIIPEGGYHPLGAKGAAMIMDIIAYLQPTHVCTPTGTATTLAGLLQTNYGNEQIISVPVLKGLNDIRQRIHFLNGGSAEKELVVFNDYHFGGYAKKTTELTDFMNWLYITYQLPTDIVYTAKMMYGIIEKIKAGYFAEGSTIVCLHTGGLQGNNSLPEGTLVF